MAGLTLTVGGQGAAFAVDDATAVRASLGYLQAQASDWGIRNAAEEFRLRGVVRDNLGQTHVRLDQIYQGVPVFGRQLIVHLDQAGTPQSATGTYLAGINVSTKPVISSQDAQAAARRRFPGALSQPPAVELVLYPKNGGVRLVYRIVLHDDQTPRRVVAFVDAITGGLVRSYNDLRTFAPAPIWPSASGATSGAATEEALSSAAAATGVGNSLYSGTVSITTTQANVRYRMVDGDRGSMRASDLHDLKFGPGMVFRDADNVWGNGTTSDRASAGVDAYFGAEMTWDYYLVAHGRTGIEGDGVGALSRVHYGRAYNNAFWSDSCKCMSYGDGDGVVFSPLTALDVAGHEMTHGVTSATAGLIYDGESGGLNEAISDIFGTMVEFYASAHGATKTANYWIGEDIYTPGTPGDALRYMDDPTKDGYSIDDYNDYHTGLDVHYSSGIANVAFYLLAEGGAHPSNGKPVTGIGRSAAEQIFYRALTVYMNPSETFSQARADTTQAAIDLYGKDSQQVISVGQTWTAVDVPL
jgi:Zn-dependent metalloprotease